MKTIIFLDIIDQTILVGIDLTPTLLSKREYRIKTHNQSINACIAYGLIRLSDYDGGKTLLDPFVKDGVIPIEAALFRKGTINAFDSLFPNVRNIEINSKLAQVRKEVNISRIDVEWLDTKLDKASVDCVVSAVPFPSKSVPEKDVEKIYKELFYQLEYIMKKKGKIVFITPKPELLKKYSEKFKILEERAVSTSNLQYFVVIFIKQNP